MRLSDRLVYPLSYGEYNFSNIPGTIISALTPETPEHMLPQDALRGLHRKYDKIVVFLMDAFGWSYFEESLKKSDFLKGLCERGCVSKMSTQFPSTTACNITTMNTAQSVAEHGIFEWFYYEPEVGEIICPLLYSYGRRARERDTLKADKNLSPAAIYPCRSIYKKLLEHGVTSYSFQSRDYAVSPYSDTTMEGARRYGYITLSDGLINLAHAVVDRPEKAYYYFYFDRIDALSHAYGPNSKELKAEIETFLLSMEKIFWDNVKGRVENVLFIMTADHGQTSINPEKCIYLNVVFPEIKKYMKTSRSGELLVPAGSCRDMFLYIKDEWMDEALQVLRENLHDKAIVLKTKELIDNGYFGQKHISEALAGRLGNIVILPFEGECVWWYEKDLFEVSFLGHHGGLTRQEMEIPFLAWEL